MSFATITAYLNQPLGAPGARWPAEFTPGRNKVSTITNGAGAFTLTLAQGACVMVQLPDVEGVFELLVPSIASANLIGHLWPVVVSFDWAQLVADGDDWALSDMDDQALLELAVDSVINVCLRANYSNDTAAAFALTALSADPDPGFEEVDAVALAVTLAAPGDVVVTHTFEANAISVLAELPILLLPEASYDIPLPAALTIRFS